MNAQNDYGSIEAQAVGKDLIERERTTGLSESAQARVCVGGRCFACRRLSVWLLSHCSLLPLPQKLTERKLAKVNAGEHDVFI